MRGAFLTIKAFIITAVAIFCVLFVYALTSVSVFPKGSRYEYYTGTSSEEIIVSRSPIKKLFLSNIKGESVRYTGDRAEELIARFHAEILFTEEAAGIVNYYCYSPSLKNSVIIGDKTVNLHIATSGSETAAGTPIIFGGF
ncbi:MAG: hypothetical protein HDP28_03285 [Clostridia bacterium]|nr:hypothetical protein [Clostridia bacterium]